MRRAAVLVILIGLIGLGACSAPATSPPPSLANQARLRAPVPAVRFESMQLVAARLPAIAADGSAVVHTVVDGDGGRGNPNLALVVRDRRDRELERFVVITANDAEGQYDEHGPSATLAQNIATANRKLEALHGTHDLRPLAKLGTAANPLATDKASHANGEGLQVDLTPHRLTIRGDGMVLVDAATPASWAIADRKLCRTCEEVCAHPMFLDAAHADVAHRLVLLTVAYTGNDTCPEPVSQHHVITW